MAQDTSKITIQPTPLRSVRQGGLIDQLMYGTLMQVYPPDPFFTAKGEGMQSEYADKIERLSLASFYGNKIPGNKDVDFQKFLKDNPGYALLKAKSRGANIITPLFFQPLGVPKIVAFSLVNIANNGFFNADIRHAFDGKCDYETIIKASQGSTAPFITNDSWLEWESGDAVPKACQLNTIQRREYQKQGLVFDPMVITNLLFLLPIDNNAQYFVLSGEGLEMVTKEGRRINAVERMSRGPKFSFLLPNLEKENLLGMLKNYYNQFMSDAVSRGLTPPIAGENTSNAFAVGKNRLSIRSLSFSTGKGSSLVLWLILCLTLSPDDPAFINKFRTSGTPYKSESFSITDLESSTANNPDVIKSFHAYTVQSIAKRLFATFDMLYRSLELGEATPGELSIISTQGGIPGTNLPFKSTKPSEKATAVSKARAEITAIIMALNTTNPETDKSLYQKLMRRLKNYVYGDSAVAQTVENFGPASRNPFRTQKTTSSFDNLEGPGNIFNVFRECSAESPGICGTLDPKNNFSFVLAIMQTSYMIVRHICAESLSDRKTVTLAEYKRHMDIYGLLYLSGAKKANLASKPALPPLHKGYATKDGTVTAPTRMVLPLRLGESTYLNYYTVSLKLPGPQALKQISEVVLDGSPGPMNDIINKENLLRFNTGFQTANTLSPGSAFNTYLSDMEIARKVYDNPDMKKARARTTNVQETGTQIGGDDMPSMGIPGGIDLPPHIAAVFERSHTGKGTTFSAQRSLMLFRGHVLSKAGITGDLPIVLVERAKLQSELYKTLGEISSQKGGTASQETVPFDSQDTFDEDAVPEVRSGSASPVGDRTRTRSESPSGADSTAPSPSSEQVVQDASEEPKQGMWHQIGKPSQETEPPQPPPAVPIREQVPSVGQQKKTIQQILEKIKEKEATTESLRQRADALEAKAQKQSDATQSEPSIPVAVAVPVQNLSSTTRTIPVATAVPVSPSPYDPSIPLAEPVTEEQVPRSASPPLPPSPPPSGPTDGSEESSTPTDKEAKLQKLVESLAVELDSLIKNEAELFLEEQENFTEKGLLTVFTKSSTSFKSYMQKNQKSLFRPTSEPSQTDGEKPIQRGQVWNLAAWRTNPPYNFKAELPNIVKRCQTHIERYMSFLWECEMSNAIERVFIRNCTTLNTLYFRELEGMKKSPENLKKTIDALKDNLKESPSPQTDSRNYKNAFMLLLFKFADANATILDLTSNPTKEKIDDFVSTELAIKQLNAPIESSSNKSRSLIPWLKGSPMMPLYNYYREIMDTKLGLLSAEGNKTDDEYRKIVLDLSPAYKSLLALNLFRLLGATASSTSLSEALEKQDVSEDETTPLKKEEVKPYTPPYLICRESNQVMFLDPTNNELKPYKPAMDKYMEVTMKWCYRFLRGLSNVICLPTGSEMAVALRAPPSTVTGSVKPDIGKYESFACQMGVLEKAIESYDEKSAVISISTVIQNNVKNLMKNEVGEGKPYPDMASLDTMIARGTRDQWLPLVLLLGFPRMEGNCIGPRLKSFVEEFNKPDSNQTPEQRQEQLDKAIKKGLFYEAKFSSLNTPKDLLPEITGKLVVSPEAKTLIEESLGRIGELVSKTLGMVKVLSRPGSKILMDLYDADRNIDPPPLNANPVSDPEADLDASSTDQSSGTETSGDQLRLNANPVAMQQTNEAPEERSGLSRKSSASSMTIGSDLYDATTVLDTDSQASTGGGRTKKRRHDSVASTRKRKKSRNKRKRSHNRTSKR